MHLRFRYLAHAEIVKNAFEVNGVEFSWDSDNLTITTNHPQTEVMGVYLKPLNPFFLSLEQLEATLAL
jgi:hypothetical protein